MKNQLYSKEFYKSLLTGSQQSAREIIPLIMEMVQPKSVVDVGCGTGGWLAVFKELGIQDYLGIDGEYVDPKMLQIPQEKFLAFDLKQPLPIEKKFDLVVSLEVAEHLPLEVAEMFVNSLTHMGEVVLFSAAIPFQGGVGHINEQWPDYWVNIFHKQGYAVADCLRKKIWNNPKVEFWYAQNILVFAQQSCLEKYPLLAKEVRETTIDMLAIVHPNAYRNVCWALERESQQRSSNNYHVPFAYSGQQMVGFEGKNDRNIANSQITNQIDTQKLVQVSSEFSGSPMQSLSVCMIVQNAEKTLELALESLDGVYDELIVVDGGSTDSTCEIALRYGAKIINSPWTGNFSDQRNLSLKEVKSDWVFIIDADEFIDVKTLEFLRYVKANGTKLDTDHFLITRKWISPFNKKYYVNSQPHFPDWQCRLYKYDKKLFYSGQIHCVLNGVKQRGNSSLELTVYHLDLLVKSESQRQEKVKIYMKDNPRDGMPHYYIPDIKQLSLQEWNHQDILSEVGKLLEAMPMKCKICEADSHHFARGTVLGKYDVNYFQCSHCGFVQTEEPYWLDEAYSQPIASSDVGLAYRNLSFSQFTKNLLFNFFNHQENFLDYGGGYGLFVRLMRDAGFDFYWFDKFCQNLFAQGFEIDETENNQFELVTAFEVFEHLVHPITELEDILKKSRNILFSTELLPESNPKPDEWWYYVLHEGQHIAIYTPKSLAIIAAKFNLNLYSNGSSLHLLTEKELPDNVFEQLAKGELAAVNKESLLQNDYLKAVQKFTTIQHSENINPRQIENNSDEQNQVNIIVDGVFFQLYRTGIARVWQSLLEEWGKTGFGKHIIVLDRAGTSPKIAGIRYLNIPPYDYGTRETDREMLQQVCDQENADLFISTYYTTPLSTPSVFMAYDMIPEVLRANLDEPMWREKHHAIRHASGYISISENTARDLTKFFPDIPLESVTVAHCGVDNLFTPASQEEINSFKTKYGISKPYFISVGGGSDYKNTILFFQAFGKLASKQGFEIVCTGTGILLEGDLRNYTLGSVVHKLHLSDQELRLAYAGAVALIYPSKYEGFGMPVLEAMSCGCPVITCPNASIPEVAGEAALYVNDQDVEGLTDALCEVQKPKIRNSLIAAGLQRAQKFSWLKMAQTMSAALINATLLPLNLRDINLIVFPDWSQPEESLGLELEGVVRAIANHPDKNKMTLLVDSSNISDEDASLALSGVAMNLLMEEDLDVSEGPEISLIGQLSEMQREILISRLHSRIVLENENTEAIAQAKAENIALFELDLKI